MNWRSLTLAILLAIAPMRAAAAPLKCTDNDAYAAEEVTDYLDSWKNVHFFYKQFRQCDDGSISEGLSESVARLMADHWGSLPQLENLTRSNATFESFVIRHLDETVTAKDLRKIRQLASQDCPIGFETLCGHIRGHLELLFKNPN